MTLQQREGDNPDQPSDNPVLAELERLNRRYMAMLLHTGLPCVVQVVTPADPATGMPLTVDALPSFQPVIYADDGTEQPQVPKPIPRCPVMLYNSGGFAMRVTPRVGDFGYLHVAERSLEAWYKGGGVPLVPPFLHTHSLSDCMFYPGGRPGPNPLQTSSTLSLGTDTGAMPGAELGELTIAPSGAVTLRSATTVGLQAPAVSLQSGDPLGVFLTTLHAALAAWTPVATDGGAALKTALAAFLAMTPPGP